MSDVPETLATTFRVQFPRFLVAGGLAACANFGSRFLFSNWVDYQWAVLMAFCVGLSSGFLLNKYFVFARSSRRVRVEFSLYLAVNLFALAQTWLVSVYGAAWLEPAIGLGPAQALAHLAGILCPVVSSYFGHKYFTFRERQPL